ncbi:MAG: sarcinarray family MAST domain-containing protein [Methanosarcinaceae archaeon]|nr:sarcinarray family MAST domain-containing protein [Methanosarcinaceae archaeon]
MKAKLILIVLLISLAILPIVVAAESPYGKIDVYYNDKLYPNTETPNPVLKIGEPFTLRFDVTMKQECKLHVKLSDLGTYQGMNNFNVVDGPSEMGEYYDRIFEENETNTFEWTLKPTDEWAGGSMPINFHYSIQVKNQYDPLVNSEFTAAVPYITNEYYEGGSSSSTTDPAEGADKIPSTPAFTLFLAIIGMMLAAVWRMR